MKEIRPPNLALEKMRSLHKRKADFRPHRPSSGGYHAPTPPQPTPSYSAPSYAPQPVIIQMMNAKIIKHSNKSVLIPHSLSSRLPPAQATAPLQQIPSQTMGPQSTTMERLIFTTRKAKLLFTS